MRHLGQPMKSFRDRKVQFPVYDEKFDRSYLDSLGALQRPGRNRAREIPAPQAASPVSLDSKPAEQLGRMFLRNAADKTVPAAAANDPTTMMGK
jgi:hypothetical protein